MQLFIFGGCFSSWWAFISASIIILGEYLNSHPSGLYITCFVIVPLHFPLLSIPCFMLFSVQLSLLSLSLSCSIFPFSVLLRADFPMRCRCGGTQIREGITEKTSLVTNVSLAMLLPNFYNWSFWSLEWKMTTLKALTDSKQAGESYSQAIRNLVQILKASAGSQSVFLLLRSKALIQNQHPQGRKHLGSETVW